MTTTMEHTMTAADRCDRCGAQAYVRAELASGRIGLDPLDREMIQPSSIDVRLDRLFRVFNNSRYTHIDPALQQDELTELVEVAECVRAGRTESTVMPLADTLDLIDRAAEHQPPSLQHPLFRKTNVQIIAPFEEETPAGHSQGRGGQA